MTAIPREHPRWFQTVAYPAGHFAQLLAFLTNKLPGYYRESLFEFPFSLPILNKMRTLLKISCRTEARSSRLSIAKVMTCWRARRADSIRITIFSSISNLLSRKTLNNQSSNGAILQRNFPTLPSWKLCLQPCWILAGNHTMHYGLNTTFTVHKVLIALWESTLLTVFLSWLLTTYPWLFDARIGYVERDGNWSLILKGRVLEYDGNMGSMSNDSRKLRKTFRWKKGKLISWAWRNTL